MDLKDVPQAQCQFGGYLRWYFVKPRKCCECLCQGVRIGKGLYELFQPREAGFVFWVGLQQRSNQNPSINKCHRV